MVYCNYSSHWHSFTASRNVNTLSYNESGVLPIEHHMESEVRAFYSSLDLTFAGGQSDNYRRRRRK